MLEVITMNFIEAVKATERGETVILKSKRNLVEKIYAKLTFQNPFRLFKNAGCFYTITTDEILSNEWEIES